MKKCEGKNRDGTPCKRNVSDDSEYCWQHIPGIWNKLTYFLADILGCKRRFLIWAILFGIVIFGFQLIITSQYNQILDDLKLKPDIEVEISPYLYTSTFGEYLPLIVTNTGDFTFENVYIDVSTCEMLDDKYYEHYKLPLLPAHSERMIPFGNIKTIEAFKKGNCYPFAGENRSSPHVSFSLGRVMKEENYTSVSTGCGWCYFNATVMAQYYDKDKTEEFTKKIRSNFSFPVSQVEITVLSADK